MNFRYANDLGYDGSNLRTSPGQYDLGHAGVTRNFSSREGTLPGHDNRAVAQNAPAAASIDTAEAASQPRSLTSVLRARRRLLEGALAVLLGLLVLAVHDVGYMLRQSFWTDEAWVAVTTRFPLSALRATTSSTPIGWTLLVRLTTVAGSQSGRLLTLAFSCAAVVAAYYFARGLGWRRTPAAVTAAVLAAVGVLLVPAMLVRDDLKQYTAEAFTALLTLALTSRLERDWSVRRLAALSVSVWAGMLVSDAVAFVGVAAFGAVCLVQLASRSWRRLVEALAAGVATAVVMLVVYEAFDAQAQARLNGSTYWSGYFLPVSKGPHAIMHFLGRIFAGVHGYFGLGPAWLAVPLVLAGLATIALQRRPATALAIVAVWPEMLVLSALHKYPFLDLRTSTFLFAVTIAVAAVGVVGICLALRRWLGPGVAVLTAATLAAFVWGAMPYVRSHPIPIEDVRQQTLYVEAHRAPDDVVVVSLASNFGFAYYWRPGAPARRPTGADRESYVAYFPDQPRIVVANSRDYAGVEAALATALTRARPHACDRIWLVRTHVSPSEAAAWAKALGQAGLPVIKVGSDGLSYIQPGGSSCH